MHSIQNPYTTSPDSNDITLMSLFLRLFGCHGNDLVVESPVKWVVWRRGGGVPIPDWNGMHSPLESGQK